MATSSEDPSNSWKTTPETPRKQTTAIDDSKQNRSNELAYISTVDPKEIFKELSSDSASEVNLPEPNLSIEVSIDQEIKEIFTQASSQRGKLLTFYIWFTIVLSAFVIALILLQAWTRIRLGDESISLVPDNVFYFLVSGMFLQFIGLLTIVTKSVWSYTDFFQYKRDITNGVRDGKSSDS